MQKSPTPVTTFYMSCSIHKHLTPNLRSTTSILSLSILDSYLEVFGCSIFITLLRSLSHIRKGNQAFPPCFSNNLKFMRFHNPPWPLKWFPFSSFLGSPLYSPGSTQSINLSASLSFLIGTSRGWRR